MFSNKMINRKSFRPNSMTNYDVKCIWCNKLNGKIEELQFENKEQKESITDLQDKNEEQQHEIDKNLKKILRLESKSKKNFKKLKIVCEELKIVSEELKRVKDGFIADKEEQKFLVVIGELVSKVYDKIYYDILTEDDTPELNKLPSNICYINFYKSAYTRYRPYLDYALIEMGLPFDDCKILVSVKNVRNNAFHQRESVAELIEDLESIDYSKYNEAKQIILSIQDML